MLSTGSPLELEPVGAPELDVPGDPGFDGETEGTDEALTEERGRNREPSLEEGVFGLRADAARKHEDEEEDSDFGFDDFDHEDETDEEEDVDDDFDDDEGDELDDDVDEFEASEEP